MIIRHKNRMINSDHVKDIERIDDNLWFEFTDRGHQDKIIYETPEQAQSAFEKIFQGFDAGFRVVEI